MSLSEKALEAKREYQRNWRKHNRERYNEYMRKWKRKNPDKVKRYNEQYWERKALED